MNAQGYTVMPTILSRISAALNVILDPIFIPSIWALQVLLLDLLC